MSRKQRAFSMAELLIALLAVSVIISATIPTFTRKASTNDSVFKWTTDGKGGYAFPNDPDGASIIIGHNRSITNIQNGDEISYNISKSNLNLVQNYRGGSNNRDISGDSDNSHLQFFNKNTTDNNIIYNVGRMYFDETNLGIGINVLGALNVGRRAQSKDDIPDLGRRNTAFGQLALFSFTSGRNSGTDNTGIGYDAVMAQEHDETNEPNGQNLYYYVDLTPTNDLNHNFGIQPSSGNTGVGSFSLTNNRNHSYNTAVGRSALYKHGRNNASNANTAVGFNSMIGDSAPENSSNILHSILNNDSGIHDNFGVGSTNTSVGAFSLSHANQATANVAIGALALHNFRGTHTTIQSKKHDGITKREDLQVDYGNVAIGTKSLGLLQNGSRNIAIGLNSARNLAGGHDNIALGFESLSNYTGCAYGTSGGCTGSLVTGGDNIAIGAFSLEDLKRGNFNVVVGNYSANNSEDLSSNVVIGTDSFQNISSNSQKNVIIGANTANMKMKINSDTASENLTKLNNSVIIGSGITIPTKLNSSSDRLFLLGEGGAQKTLLFSGIMPNGNYTGHLNIHAKQVGFADNVYVGVNVDGSEPSDTSGWKENEIDNVAGTHGELHVGNKVGIGYSINASDPAIMLNAATDKPQFTIKRGSTQIFGVDSSIGDNGQVTVKGDLVVDGHIYGSLYKKEDDIPILKSCRIYHGGGTCSYSDARLKNIGSDSVAGLKEINALEVKNFTFKKDEKKTPHVGVIAQQLQKIFPNAVTKDEEGYLLIRTEDIFYAMVNSIKELFKDLQNLTAKVTGLDKRIETLEKQNKQLTEQNKAFEARLKKLESKVK